MTQLRRRGRVLTAVSALLAAAACTEAGAPHPTAGSTPPPVSCAAEHCSTPGAIRWSVPLGVSMTAQLGAPATYLSPAAHARPEFAAIGSTVVVGWDRTLVGLDARTGAKRWRTGTDVAPGRYVTAVHPVGSLAAVTAQPEHGKASGTEYLLDPRTGHVVSRLPAREFEGAVWTDGRTVVAVEPHALVRSVIATGRAVWSIPLPDSRFRKPRSGFGAPFVTAAVAGDAVAFGSTDSGVRLVRLSDGRPVTGADPVRGQLYAARGGALVLTSPASVYDVGAGHARWTGPVNSDVQAVDEGDGRVYVSYPDGHSVRSVALATGAVSALPASVRFDDLIAVRRGAAVYAVDTWPGGLPSSTYFVGRDVRTGAARWSTYSLNNLFLAPSLYWHDSGDYVGGFTCSKLAARDVCQNTTLTLVNI